MPNEPPTTETTQPQQVMGPGASYERRNITRSGRRPQYDGDERTSSSKISELVVASGSFSRVRPHILMYEQNFKSHINS